MGLISYIYDFFKTFIIENVEEVKSVDLQFDQFVTDQDGSTDSRDNPRVLIQIDEFEPVQGFGGIQNWVTEVSLFVGIDITGGFANDASYLDKNLAYLEILDKIYLALSRISSFNFPDDIQPRPYRIYQVERSRVLFARNPGPIKITELVFRCVVEDNSAGFVPIVDNIDTIDLTIVVDR